MGRIRTAGKSDDQYILGIEAATPAGGVALATDAGRLIGHIWRETPRPVASSLLADVDALMRDCGAAAERIRAVAVSIGPGSFTGLRVGLALAKTLACEWGMAREGGCPLYGYSTLAAAAARWPLDGAAVCVLLDARRGELYRGLYGVRAGGRPEALLADRVAPADALLEELAGSGFPVIYFSGAGAALYRGAIEARLAERARWVPEPWSGPAADSLVKAAALDLREGKPGLDPIEARPRYLRVSDAEKRLIPPGADESRS